MRIFSFLISWFLVISATYPQNIGIQTTTPSQPLEVGGIIFSNTDGFMFPDSSLQTTAAYQVDPMMASDTGRMFAVMVVQDIQGPFQYDMFNDAFRVFDFELELLDRRAPFGGGTTPPDATTASFEVLIDIGRGLPAFFQKYAELSQIQLIRIYLLKSVPGPQSYHPYFIIGMEDILLVQIKEAVKYKGENTYAHLYWLNFHPRRLSMKHDESGGNCFCWDFYQKMACNCID